MTYAAAPLSKPNFPFYFRKWKKVWYVHTSFNLEDFTPEEIVAMFQPGKKVEVTLANGGTTERVIKSFHKITASREGDRIAYFAVEEVGRKKRILVVADVYEKGETVSGVKIDGFGRSWTTSIATAVKRDAVGWERLDDTPKSVNVCYAYGVAVSGHKPAPKTIPLSAISYSKVKDGKVGDLVESLYKITVSGLFYGMARKIDGAYRFSGFASGERTFSTLKEIKEAIASGTEEHDPDYKDMREQEAQDRNFSRSRGYNIVRKATERSERATQIFRQRYKDHPIYGRAS